MDYYRVSFDPGERLGISVITRNENDPKIGQTGAYSESNSLVAQCFGGFSC